jgi:hypothetical protein
VHDNYNCAVLTVGNDGVSQLHIMQALQHKTVELLTVEFVRSSEYGRRLPEGLVARELWRQPPFFINAGRV